MTWYWTEQVICTKTLSLVFVSQRTSSCCTRRETVPERKELEQEK